MCNMFLLADINLRCSFWDIIATMKKNNKKTQLVRTFFKHKNFQVGPFPFFPFLNWTSATFLLEVLEFAFRVCWVNHGRVEIPLRIWWTMSFNNNPWSFSSTWWFLLVSSKMWWFLLFLFLFPRFHVSYINFKMVSMVSMVSFVFCMVSMVSC